MAGEAMAFFAFGVAMYLSGLITGALWREVCRKIGRTRFGQAVGRFLDTLAVGFDLSKRAFDNCEGCYARPACRWTDDDAHLCQKCYAEILRSPSPDTRDNDNQRA